MAGADPYRWQADAARGMFPEVPLGSRGCPRRFQLDDIICLKLWAELDRNGFKRQTAADIATQVRRLLRQYDDLPRAYVIREETPIGPRPRVVATVAEGQHVLMSFSVATYRAALEAPFAGLAS